MSGGRWVERVRAAPVIFGITAINVVVFLVAETHGGTTSSANLLRFGAVETDHVWSGEYWRLATYMFLHIGWVHLLWNSYASFGWCMQVERVLGSPRFLVVYLVSGLAGGVASTVLPYAVSAGASGAMFGIIGATLALRRRQLPSFAAAWSDPPTRATLLNIGLWTVIGLTALPMNNRAHFGGLVGGAVTTWVMTADPRRRGVFGVAWGAAFAVALLFATRPWLRGRLPTANADDPVTNRLMDLCRREVLAACFAVELNMPDDVGDTTRDLEPICNDMGQVDACAAWGWSVAHGRPGVPKDAARGKALLDDACAKGSAWGCELAKGRSPIEALPRDAGL
jgi:membrane associated rhomboid family serine protease